MPETDVQDGAEEEALDEPASTATHCRHCGAFIDAVALFGKGDDWQCPACERFQDSMTCPTCGNVARISLLPAELAPAPHAPARRRKPKEE